MTAILSKARKGRESLPPNLYSGAFLLGRYFTMERKKFVPTEDTKNERVKIYTNGKKFYTVPPVGHEPLPGYNWHNVGRLHSRDIYVASSTRHGV